MAQAAVVVGAGLKAIGSIAGGRAEEKNAKDHAAALRMQRNVVQVAAQRDASAYRRSANRAVSAGVAAVGTSGTARDSVTTLNALADIAAQGEAAALDRLWAGDMEVKMIDKERSATLRSGRAAKMAGFLGAAGSIVSGVSAWQSIYGGGGSSIPQPTSGTAGV